MNFVISERVAKLISFGVCASFLLIHVLMLVVFGMNGVMPMVYFNIFSVAFYCLVWILPFRGHFRSYVLLVYLEVLAHMVTAVVFVGWNCGFQITLIGISAMLYFAEYAGRNMERKYVRALPLCGFSMVCYIAAYMVTSAYPPTYQMSAETEYFLQIFWALITFVIATATLQIFIWATFKAEAILSGRASHDKLTGLPNRYYMSEYLNKPENHEHDQLRWLAIADIDDFKNINDTYGHNCGDYVLKTLAEIVRSFKLDAELCRWGGEEFLMAGSTEGSMDGVVAALNRLRVTIAEHNFWYEEHKLNIAVTIGVAEYSPDETVIEWINRADKNLYRGKRNGKNQVVA